MNLVSRALTAILLIAGQLPGWAQVTVYSTSQEAPVSFGLQRLESACQKSRLRVLKPKQNASEPSEGILIRINKQAAIPAEGFSIARTGRKLTIDASDANGGMYGALEVARQIESGTSWYSIKSKRSTPHLKIRAIKFNLPWSPYRTGPAMDQHLTTCRDLDFWRGFLDQMAENRFNVLSLWNVHPFSYMVKPTHFPQANRFTEPEMAEWKKFWTALFRMARDRGIEPFIVNWNIAVSPEFAEAYNVRERNDTSALVKQYTREVVTQVINEYPDLAGIGITLADWMSNFSSPGTTLPEMTPKSRENWISETVIAGIKEATRPVKLLHRSVLSADPKEMRRVIDEAQLPDTTMVEVKFNWSHGHSATSLYLTHDSNSGARDDGYWNPLPSNYRIEWMIRNEDFFILRWGQPDFIRAHIRNNVKPFVNGYFVGSEGYIPAMDYSHLEGPHKSWKYAFEKQWLFYMTWGHLMYDPTTPNEVFESAFDTRFGTKIGKTMIDASTRASNMPLRLASYYKATWDYTLYSEGFLSPSPSSGLNDKVSSFISVDELIDHPTLDPRYVSIKDFVANGNRSTVATDGKIGPLELADSLEIDSKEVLRAVLQLRTAAPSSVLTCELDDLETWAWLSAYFADKLRAGVSLQSFRTGADAAGRAKAVELLRKCKTYWQRVSEITGRHYREVSFIDDTSDARTFSWSNFMPQVDRDISIAETGR